MTLTEAQRRTLHIEALAHLYPRKKLEQASMAELRRAVWAHNLKIDESPRYSTAEFINILRWYGEQQNQALAPWCPPPIALRTREATSSNTSRNTSWEPPSIALRRK